MGRTRSPDSVEAERLFHEGMPLVDIAKKLKVPAGTVRRWKSTQKWAETPSEDDKKKQSERSETKASVRKRGAPLGNQNSKGHKPSSPKGNKNAFKHGGYSPVYWDTLDDDEKNLIEEMESDPEIVLIEQIQLYSIRERRLMNLINKYRNMVSADGKEIQVYMQMSNRSERKRVFDGTPEEQKAQKEEYDEIVKQEIEDGKRKPGRDVQLFTQTENKDVIIARLEDQLTRCSSAKSKAIAELIKLQTEKQRMAGGGANDLVRAFIEGLPDMEVDNG